MKREGMNKNRAAMSIQRMKSWIIVSCLMLLCQPVWAGLPMSETAGKALAAKGNWLDVIKLYMKQGGTILGLTIAMLSFLWISYAALSKFNACRTGKAEWGELGVLVVTGSGMLVFITLLLKTASTIL